MRDHIMRRLQRPRWTETGHQVRHRTEPPPTTPPADPPAGDPPAGDPPADPPAGDPPAGGGNAAAAQTRLQRERDQARQEAEEAKRKLQEAEDAKKDDLTKEREAREKAERERDAAKELATKAEVKTKLLGLAGTHTSAVQAAVDLSADKLLDLKDSTPEELNAHLKTTVETYSLPEPSGDPPTPPPGFGQPPGAGAAPAGGGKGGKGGTDEGATGEPSKDYRKGIGRGILGIAQRSGVAQPPDDDD